MNYSIDYGLRDKFIESVGRVCVFYLEIRESNFALFYYDQLRIVGVHLSMPNVIV